MHSLFLGIIGLITLGSITKDLKNDAASQDCVHNKESMVVVMRFELKVKPAYVALLKESFSACKIEVLEKESGCLDYTLFQSYSDSTLFVINETWKTKGDHNVHMQLEHTKKHLAETRDIHDPSFKSSTNYVYWICPEANKKE